MTLKIQKSIAISFIVLSFTCVKICAAQDFHLLPKVPRIYHYSKVEQALRDQLEGNKTGNEFSEKMRGELINALKEGYFITDETIIRIKKIWLNYHTDRNEMISFLEELSQNVYDRPELELNLLKSKLNLIDPETNIEVFNGEGEDLWKIAKYARIRIDYYDITTTFDAGKVAVKEGDVKKADVLFSKVFYYPWYSIDASRPLEYFYDLYVRSGKYLIALRKDDLPALERLKFAPVAEKDLNPILQRAIEETKEMNAKKKEDVNK